MTNSASSRRVGILGGTFNPVHMAHLVIGERFADACNLDRVVFVPAAVSPFKVKQQESTAAAHRLAMLQRAIMDNSRFSIDEWELRRGGTSYTVQTLEYFRKHYKTPELHLLIGADQAKQFHDWREWRKILTLAQLCIVRRPGSQLDVRVQQELTFGGRPPILVNCPQLDISSTEIRRRVSEGLSIRYLTPDSVVDYIDEYSLYRS